MYLVAGPPGSGKSKAFPLKNTAFDFFNIDDRCAELNNGSYVNIPPEIRSSAQKECENFINQHIADGKSFAVETTLRTTVSITQAKAAQTRGFVTIMIYVCTDDVNENVFRVTKRGHGGGHSAPPTVIRETYFASLSNLPLAVECFDKIDLYDSTERSTAPKLVLEIQSGAIGYRATLLPNWVRETLGRYKELV